MASRRVRTVVVVVLTTAVFWSSHLAFGLHDTGCKIDTYTYTPSSMTMRFGLDPAKCPPLGDWIHIEGTMRRNGNIESEAKDQIECEAMAACVLELTLTHPNPEQADYGASFSWHSQNGSKGGYSTGMPGCKAAGPITETFEGIAVWSGDEQIWLVRWRDIWEPLGLHH